MRASPFGVDDPAVVAALGAYVKLLRAARAVLARVEPRVTAAGLTITQFGVLEALLHAGPLTQRELGRKVLTSAGNMTDLIDKLEARGLARRRRKPDDRRAIEVELTDAGRDTISRLFPPHARDIAGAMSALNSGDLRQLSRLLRKLGAGPQQAPLAPEVKRITSASNSKASNRHRRSHDRGSPLRLPREIPQ